jgi:cell division protease FtsH
MRTLQPRRSSWTGVLVVIAALLATTLFVGAGNAGDESVDITLDELETFVAEDRLVEAEIRVDADNVVGTFDPESSGGDPMPFETPYPDGFEGELTTLLLGSSATTTVERSGPPLISFILGILPLLLLGGLALFFVLRMGRSSSGLLSVGRAKAKRFSADQPHVTFDDVAGLDEAVEELSEIRDFLESPAKYTAMGAKVPKGVLLAGPPGTGKTLLARAVAGEAGVPFFSISGSDFVEMFVGVGASRVRDLFTQASAAGPAIVFIDEIDAVGRHRGAGLGGGNDEREQTLNQLLVEMDGFDSETGVVVIAATNRPDVLDSALLRPGRFDRQVIVGRPDRESRAAILHVHAAGKPLDGEVDLDVVARRTPGFTGADLANLLNEGTLLATRRGRTTVTNLDLEEATDKVMAGPERRSAVLSTAEQTVIAIHEAGHALVGWALPCADPIHKVTIIPRGRALGFTQALPTDDRHLVHRSQLWNQLAMLSGGRAAEELVFGDPTTGAANDLEKATEIARQMVERYGMSDRLGFVDVSAPDPVFPGHGAGTSAAHSDETRRAIDEEIRGIIAAAQREAATILAANRSALDAMAAALLDRETLDAAEIADLFSDVPKWRRLRQGAGAIEPTSADASAHAAA